MRTVLRFLTVACATAALCTPAWAESPGSLEVDVFGGYNLKGKHNELGDPASSTNAVQPGPGLGLRLGYALMDRLSVEAEVKYVMSTIGGSSDSAGILGVRGHALLNLVTEGAVRPFVRVGGGSEMIRTSSKLIASPSDKDSAAIFGAGSRFAFTEEMGARVDLLGVVVPDIGPGSGMEFEGWLALYYTFGQIPKDTDGDGIVDKTDKCPTEREDKDDFQDLDGCPDPDNDGDGIADTDDKCPNDAEVKNGLKDLDGCPDGDKDGDGIEDSDDKCPTQAESKNGFQDEDGCPDDPDSDGDGIADSKDKCPKQPETKNGYKDDDGCPDQEPDSDGDGLVDSQDKCPKEPETKNSYQDDDGCPDVVPEKLKKFSGAIQGIEFETGSAKILPKSFVILDGAVAVLVEFKDTKIQVQGHTDNVGKEEANKKLSQERAASVKAYFVEKGIAEARITTEGYGSENPVADNKTKAGKAKNRRIEFKLQ